MTAVATCRNCGTEPRQGARFCDACGSEITPATDHAEFKQVTVLLPMWCIRLISRRLSVRSGYRDMATSLSFEGQMAWARAMS
jgi:hypothetical protein